MNRRSAFLAPLALCASAAATAAAPATAPAAGSPATAELIDKLGLHIAPQPVRERPGWRPPRIVLINEEMLELRPALGAVDRKDAFANSTNTLTEPSDK